MIVTLTPNPSLDRTIEVERLVVGAVLRTSATRVDAGGKGVNVSRALTSNAYATHAVLPVGGPEGAQLVALLEAAGIAHSVVPISASTRANVTVAEADGTTTKLNEEGPPLNRDDVDALVSLVTSALHGAGRAAGTPVADDAAPSWVAVCGSLPAGVPHDIYSVLADAVHREGGRLAVDASGEALRMAVAAGPDLVKPNLEELAEFCGRPLEGLADVIAAAMQMREKGAGTVLASLGAQGAVLVDADGAHFGSARVERPRSTVGAGDSMLAGYLSRAGHPPADALATALAWGAAATTLPGSVMPGPDDVDLSAVIVTPRPDLELRWEAAP